MIQVPPIRDPGLDRVPEWVAPFAAMMLVIAAGVFLVMPLIRAWAKRLERGTSDADGALHEEVRQLRDRVSELEGTAMHVAELEERLDFAERLLAQRDVARVPDGSVRQ